MMKYTKLAKLNRWTMFMCDHSTPPQCHNCTTTEELAVRKVTQHYLPGHSSNSAAMRVSGMEIITPSLK